MSKLKAATRNALPTSKFALPKERKYPVPDKAHAANAKARATQQVAKGNLSASAAARIRAKANAVLAGCLLLVLSASLHAQVYNPTTGWFGQTIIPITFANWSALGTGCTSSSVSSVGGGAIKVVSSTGAQNICGMQTPASGTFSHIAVIYALPFTANFSSIEFGVTDGTKVEYCAIQNVTGSTAPEILGIKSTALTVGTLTAANGPGTSSALPVGTGPIFLRVSAAAGTNLACDYSADGVNWVNLFTDTTPFLTPSAIYFGTDPRAATGAGVGILASYN